MKKLAAILLCLVHLLTITGYALFFQFFIIQSDNQVEAKLDRNNYSNTELVEIKVPLHLPYSTNWKGYERCDGQIEVNGNHYNYVKRKLSNDTLYILCIPNSVKTQLSTAQKNYASEFSEANATQKNNQSTVKKQSPIVEYCFQPLHFTTTTLVAIEQQKNNSFSTSILIRYCETRGKPPQAHC